MYILVRKSDNIIIGSAMNPINKENAEKNGYDVYEIDKSEFSDKLIGSKLEKFDEIK
jgi:N-dimethylarginine dimethylaminohydrolase